MAKLHAPHPTQAAACGANSSVSVVNEEEFLASEHQQCLRCRRVLDAKNEGRRHYRGAVKDILCPTVLIVDDKEKIMGKNQVVNPSTLVGKVFDLYGVDNNVFCIGTDGERRAYEVLEDESDGHRSYLDHMEEVPLHGLAIPRYPIARVTVEPDSDLDGWKLVGEGWKLVGEDGYVWLQFGTDNLDDYYPSFIFNFYPRGPK